MHSLRLKNFRGFEDTGRVPIRRITVLVGANSTGKSGFLRVFPLLRQSIQTPTSGPILWYDERLVDYGSFAEARRKNSKDQGIWFEFGLSLRPFIKDQFVYPNEQIPYGLIEDDHDLQLSVLLQEAKQRTFAARVDLRIEADQAEIEFNESGQVVRFQTNGEPRNISEEWIRHHSGPVPSVEQVEILFQMHNIIPSDMA